MFADIACLLYVCLSNLPRFPNLLVNVETCLSDCLKYMKLLFIGSRCLVNLAVSSAKIKLNTLVSVRRSVMIRLEFSIPSNCDFPKYFAENPFGQFKSKLNFIYRIIFNRSEKQSMVLSIVIFFS